MAVAEAADLSRQGDIDTEGHYAVVASNTFHDARFWSAETSTRLPIGGSVSLIDRFPEGVIFDFEEKRDGGVVDRAGVDSHHSRFRFFLNPVGSNFRVLVVKSMLNLN